MADQRLTVLTYHALDGRGDVISTAPDLFESQLQHLAASGINGISLRTAWERLEQDGRFPESSVVLTFDDGYLSVFENALPALRRHGFRATVFVPTAFVGRKTEEAFDLNEHLDREMMNWGQLEELAAAGMEIAAHSRKHPDLTRLDDRELEDELAGCLLELENRIHRPVVSFAYPYGFYDERVRHAVGHHYRYACTTALGHNGLNTDPLSIRRIDAFYLKRESMLLRAARGELGGWCVKRQVLRDTREWFSRRSR
ncbi:MAG: polysaccharide deacetylase family protein [Lysobacterales bacterium]|jgi:peptidoglycan/xylan/chitin deacetylase (PgdA/CDA1 family)